jgi:hypothetical protein
LVDCQSDGLATVACSSCGPDPILVHRDGLVLYANAATLATLKAGANEGIGQSVLNFVHDECRDAFLAGGAAGELTLYQGRRRVHR